MKYAGTPRRFAAAVPDRREQRKLDQALCLVPFSVKLNIDLVAQLRGRAQTCGISINALTAELLQSALAK